MSQPSAYQLAELTRQFAHELGASTDTNQRRLKRAVFTLGSDQVRIMVDEALERQLLGDARDAAGSRASTVALFWDLVRLTATPEQQAVIFGPQQH